MAINVQNTNCKQSQEYVMENVPAKTWRTEITWDGSDFKWHISIVHVNLYIHWIHGHATTASIIYNGY